MERDQLIQRIVRCGVPAPAGRQLAVLEDVVRTYADVGVLGADVDPALHRCCPDAIACWEGIPESQRPSGVGRFDPRSERGSIFVPWVGRHYDAGGVCVLGMNLRYGGEDWELGIEHRIALDPKWGQHQSLRDGHRAHRSNWSTGTMRDAAAVLRSIRGATVLETRDRGELAQTLLASARLQAVKCSPIGGRSSPTQAMSRHCPQRFLQRELEVLQPLVLLAYGGPAHGAVRQLGAVTVEERVRGLVRATIASKAGGCVVFLMTHPAHGGWHAAHRALVASLQARPIRVRPDAGPGDTPTHSGREENDA